MKKVIFVLAVYLLSFHISYVTFAFENENQIVQFYQEDEVNDIDVDVRSPDDTVTETSWNDDIGIETRSAEEYAEEHSNNTDTYQTYINWFLGLAWVWALAYSSYDFSSGIRYTLGVLAIRTASSLLFFVNEI